MGPACMPIAICINFQQYTYPAWMHVCTQICHDSTICADAWLVKLIACMLAIAGEAKAGHQKHLATIDEAHDVGLDVAKSRVIPYVVHIHSGPEVRPGLGIGKEVGAHLNVWCLRVYYMILHMARMSFQHTHTIEYKMHACQGTWFPKDLV